VKKAHTNHAHAHTNRVLWNRTIYNKQSIRVRGIVCRLCKYLLHDYRIESSKHPLILACHVWYNYGIAVNNHSEKVWG